jgi:hypothetical protein
VASKPWAQMVKWALSGGTLRGFQQWILIQHHVDFNLVFVPFAKALQGFRSVFLKFK